MYDFNSCLTTNKGLTSTIASLQQLSHFNKCHTSKIVSLQRVSHFNKCLTSTSISLQQVYHFNKCFTSINVWFQLVSYNKQGSHFNNCLTSTSVSLQQVYQFNECITSSISLITQQVAVPLMDVWVVGEVCPGEQRLMDHSFVSLLRGPLFTS